MEGKIKIIGEHKLIIPELPRNRKSEILFLNEKPDRAFWDRSRLITDFRDVFISFIPHFTKVYQQATLYDQDGILISLNKEDSDYVVRTYEQEMRRRREGVWFKNKEEITHITGDHYFAIMHCKMQRHDGLGDYGDYREFQGDFFHLINHCYETPDILGGIFSKAKKTGITNLFWLHYLNRATMNKNKNYGYMNIEQGQAAKTWRDYFLYSYNNMLPALRPQFKSKSEVDGTIIFGKAYSNSKKSRQIAYDSEDELNSSVFCVPTKDKAFDVAVMNAIAFDEPTKYKQSFAEIWRTNKEAVKIQSKFNGRAFIFNYTIGDDTQSFRETREVFLDSELRTITPLSKNQTKSGLIAYHIPAYASWEGAFDKHGICDEKKASKEIQFERDKVKGNKRALQAITRQYANNKREAWGSAGSGSTFDNIRLGDLLADLEIDGRDAPVNEYIEGNFIWDGKPLWNLGLRNKRKKGEFTNVKFVPLTEDELELGVTGKFRIFYDIPKEQQNLALKQGRDDWNNLLPPARYPSIVGGDPTNYAAGSAVTEGSKNGGYVIGVPDALDNTGRSLGRKLLIEYYDRPELPDEAFEDYLMLIIYTGSLSLIEGNAAYCFTRLMEEGLGHYLLVKDENGIATVWKRWFGLSYEKEKQYRSIKLTANSGEREMLEALVRCIKNYIEKPNLGEIDYGKMIKSSRLVRQLMDFNSLDTKLYDLAISLGWTLYALEIYMDILLETVNDNDNPQNIEAILNAFSYD
jgi:hypothetical protein